MVPEDGWGSGFGAGQLTRREGAKGYTDARAYHPKHFPEVGGGDFGAVAC
jgi:hypothetical protein